MIAKLLFKLRTFQGRLTGGSVCQARGQGVASGHVAHGVGRGMARREMVRVGLAGALGREGRGHDPLSLENR
jgi:hypothetical protein